MELDKKVQASGFSKEDTHAFDDAMEAYRQNAGLEEGVGNENGNDDEEDDDDDSDGADSEVEESDEQEAANTVDTLDVVNKDEKVVVAGEEFSMLKVTGESELDESKEEGAATLKHDDGDGGQQSDANTDDSEGEEGDEDDDGTTTQTQRTDVMEAKPYEAKDDIRRAWRFSSRQGGGGGGGACLVPCALRCIFGLIFADDCLEFLYVPIQIIVHSPMYIHVHTRVYTHVCTCMRYSGWPPGGGRVYMHGSQILAQFVDYFMNHSLAIVKTILRS